MSKGVSSLFHGTKGERIAQAADQNLLAEKENDKAVAPFEEALLEEALIAELERQGVKFTKEDIVFITKDETGQIVWLEKGSASAGLEHILNGNGKTSGHALDFEKALGAQAEDIPSFLKSVVSDGKVVLNVLKMIKERPGFERIYYYNNRHYVLLGIGTNGFIVTAYPTEYEGE